MGPTIQARRDAEPLPHVPVVLLCAEDDDLELVSFVHTARLHGLEPEVVPGVEENGRPLRQALAQNGDALFVVLRSDNLTQARTLALKRLFERRSKRGQHLLALRLEPTRSEHAVNTIARRLRELMKAAPKNTGPHKKIDADQDSVPIELGDLQAGDADDEPTTIWPPPAASGRPPPPPAPKSRPADDLWDDRTVVADHLPRPPRTVTDHTIVADHLPRPPAIDPARPQGVDDAGSDPLAELAARLAEDLGTATDEGIVAEPTVAETGEEAPRPAKSTNTGLWFALALLALAAWHVTTLFRANSAPASASAPEHDE